MIPVCQRPDVLSDLPTRGIDLDTVAAPCRRAHHNGCTLGRIRSERETDFGTTLTSARRPPPVTNQLAMKEKLNKTCLGIPSNRAGKIRLNDPWVYFTDILLVVVFNKPHFENIPLIEILYRPFFLHILYCGPGSVEMSFEHYDFRYLSYTETPKGHYPGSFNYECMVSAMTMNYTVKGYLFLADDTLWSVHKVPSLNKSSIWYLPKHVISVGNISLDPPPSWNSHAWGFRLYQTQVQNALRRMELEYSTNSVVGQCYRTLQAVNGGKHMVSGNLADVYYIPQRLAAQFAEVGLLFLEEKVFLEIAVPTIITCLESEGSSLEEIVGLYRGVVRVTPPWLLLNKDMFADKVFLHPCKWGPLATGVGDPTLRLFFCETVLPWLHDPQGRLADQKFTTLSNHQFAPHLQNSFTVEC